MLSEVGNPIFIVDSVLCIGSLYRAHSIFQNENRLIVAIIHLIAYNAQPYRINLPTPFCGNKLVIFQTARHVSTGHLLAYG